MATTIDSLANETLSEIFAASKSADLCHAALVCRRWRDPAQLAFFSDVELVSQRQADKWLTFPARERFRVKGIRLGYYVKAKIILEMCGGLRFLALRGLPGDMLLLRSLADVNSLELFRPEDVVVPGHGQPPFRLSHLEVSLDRDVPADLFRFLLLPSISTLSSLSISQFGSGTDLSGAKSFIPSHPFIIKHLTVVFYTLPSPELPRRSRRRWRSSLFGGTILTGLWEP